MTLMNADFTLFQLDIYSRSIWTIFCCWL